MKAIHYIMLVCGALAAGLPAMSESLPPSAAPYAKAASACLVLIASVLGAISPSAVAALKDGAK